MQLSAYVDFINCAAEYNGSTCVVINAVEVAAFCMRVVRELELLRQVVITILADRRQAARAPFLCAYCIV